MKEKNYSHENGTIKCQRIEKEKNSSRRRRRRQNYYPNFPREISPS